jgi:predicted SprT family Zn-dependent metalloprotease
MDLVEAEILAKRLISKYVPEYSFKWNRAKGINGICHYRTKTIELSAPLSALRTREAVHITIMHEIAHALTPTDGGHGDLWKMQMMRFGLPTDRCSKDKVDRTHLAKWKMVCISCKHDAYFMRKPKYARSCGKCNPGRFDRRYLMELTQLR